jgi:hypothetical protein
MDLLIALGRTLGFSFAAGVNLYATVAILGLTSRYHWVDLPPQFAVFDNNFVIGAAIVLYIVEFIADRSRGSIPCGIPCTPPYGRSAGRWSPWRRSGTPPQVFKGSSRCSVARWRRAVT